jgi:hypothetical protein
MDKIYIEYKGFSYVFENNTKENRDAFRDKCWFIVKNKDTPNILHLSDIWINKKKFGLVYPKHIEDLFATLHT